MAAVFMGHQPPVRVHRTYPRLSSAAFKRLAILILAGWAVKTALSSYSDAVFPNSPFGFRSPESEASSTGGFVVVHPKSSASSTVNYRKGFKGGEQNSLVNISGQPNNTLISMSPGIGSIIFGPLLDISSNKEYSTQLGTNDTTSLGAPDIHKHFMDITQASLADVHVVDAAFITKDIAKYITFQTVLATLQRLNYFSVDESTMYDRLDHGVDSLSHRGDPNSWSVVVFAHPTSPFVNTRNNEPFFGQTNNVVIDISPGIGSNIFGPLLDILSNEMNGIQQFSSDATPLCGAAISKASSLLSNLTEAHFMDVSQASNADVYVVDATIPIQYLANLMQFQMTVATQECLNHFTVDESTMHDNLDHGVDSLSLRGDPKSWSVVVFAHPTSPFVYRSSAFSGEHLSVSSPALPVDVGRDEMDGSRQLSNIDWNIYMAFGLGLVALLSLLFRHLQYTVTKPPAPAPRPTLQYIRYDSLSSFGRMQEQKLDTLFECRFSGCKFDRYIEVWYSKVTMDSVNKFLANGCQYLPEQWGQGFWAILSSILSVIAEFMECFVMLLFLVHSFYGRFEVYFIGVFKIIAVLLLLGGASLYFRQLTTVQRLFNVNGKRRKKLRLSSVLAILSVIVEFMECFLILLFLVHSYCGQFEGYFIGIFKAINGRPTPLQRQWQVNEETMQTSWYLFHLDVIQASQVDEYGVDPTSPTNYPASLIQIQMTVATQECLNHFTVDESTMHDNLDHGVDSLSLRGDPKSWSVVVFAHPTSPFVYRSSAFSGEHLSVSSPALPVYIGRDETDGSRQLSNINWKIYTAFGLGLVALLSLLF
uniref:Uncharacterized protein n=1 Tax=Psilocybe cubensis TaxID=181762 RepID=A0A8H7Y267_PSICU